LKRNIIHIIKDLNHNKAALRFDSFTKEHSLPHPTKEALWRTLLLHLQKSSDEYWVKTRDPNQSLHKWRGPPTIIVNITQNSKFLE
jgi:hypothetical protein